VYVRVRACVRVCECECKRECINRCVRVCVCVALAHEKAAICRSRSSKRCCDNCPTCMQMFFCFVPFTEYTISRRSHTKRQLCRSQSFFFFFKKKNIYIYIYTISRRSHTKRQLCRSQSSRRCCDNFPMCIATSSRIFCAF